VSGFDIAAFAALGWEARAVLAGLQDVRPVEGQRSWHGRLRDGRTCVVVQTGMGAERATTAARLAPAADLFLSCGCGGGLLPWLRTGDIVVATEVVRLDASCRPAASTAAVVPPVELGAHAGVVASSPTALVTAAEKTAAAGCGALLVDMESWSLAVEAERRGAQLAVVRVVLDVAGDELGALAGAIDATTGDIDPWRAARVLLPRPWTWPAALQLARQQGEAAERLTEAISALSAARNGSAGAPAAARS
jgi:nucleoside phosphorylase